MKHIAISSYTDFMCVRICKTVLGHILKLPELFHPNACIHLYQLDVNFGNINNLYEHPISKQNTYIDSLISGDFVFVIVF